MYEEKTMSKIGNTKGRKNAIIRVVVGVAPRKKLALAVCGYL